MLTHTVDVWCMFTCLFAKSLCGNSTIYWCILCFVLHFASSSCFFFGVGGGPSVVDQGSFIVYKEQCIWFVSLVACVWATKHVCMPLLITVHVSPPVSVILGKSHYVLYNLVAAMQPRMLVTFDEELRPLPVSVRVGQVRGFTFFYTPGQPCHPPAAPPPHPPMTRLLRPATWLFNYLIWH